jgi:hypothetical protein
MRTWVLYNFTQRLGLEHEGGHRGHNPALCIIFFFTCFFLENCTSPRQTCHQSHLGREGGGGRGMLCLYHIFLLQQYFLFNLFFGSGQEVLTILFTCNFTIRNSLVSNLVSHLRDFFGLRLLVIFQANLSIQLWRSSLSKNPQTLRNRSLRSWRGKRPGPWCWPNLSPSVESSEVLS